MIHEDKMIRPGEGVLSRKEIRDIACDIADAAIGMSQNIKRRAMQEFKKSIKLLDLSGMGYLERRAFLNGMKKAFELMAELIEKLK